MNNRLSEEEAILDSIVATPYKYGFTTDIETEEFEKGLNKDIINKISSKKDEPEFLKKFRDKAFTSWKKMQEPSWSSLSISEIDYENIQYYSVPKTKKKLGSLETQIPNFLKLLIS